MVLKDCFHGDEENVFEIFEVLIRIMGQENVNAYFTILRLNIIKGIVKENYLVNLKEYLVSILQKDKYPEGYWGRYELRCFRQWMRK